MSDALIVRRTSGNGELSVIYGGYVSIPLGQGNSSDRHGTITFSETIDPKKIMATVFRVRNQEIALNGGYANDYESLGGNTNYQLRVVSITETQMEVYLASYPSGVGSSCNVSVYFYIKQ